MAAVTRTVPRFITAASRRQFSTSRILRSGQDEQFGMPLRTLPGFHNFNPGKFAHRHAFTLGFIVFCSSALNLPFWLMRRYCLYQG